MKACVTGPSASLPKPLALLDQLSEPGSELRRQLCIAASELSQLIARDQQRALTQVRIIVWPRVDVRNGPVGSVLVLCAYVSSLLAVRGIVRVGHSLHQLSCTAPFVVGAWFMVAAIHCLTCGHRFGKMHVPLHSRGTENMRAREMLIITAGIYAYYAYILASSVAAVSLRFQVHRPLAPDPMMCIVMMRMIELKCIFQEH
jgi:hypothetical protein